MHTSEKEKKNHFIIYTGIKPLCCIPSTRLYWLYLNKNKSSCKQPNFKPQENIKGQQN